jgi:hypothetical protein
MMLLWTLFRALVLGHATLIAENLALRQQLAVLRRSVCRPRLPWRNRLFWTILSCCWSGGQSALLIVSPAIVGGPVIGVTMVGGLHHRYRHVA